MSYTPPLDAETTAFKTTALLANGSTYDSSTIDWDGDVSGYSQVQTEILASHDGTIAIDFCEDAAFTDVCQYLIRQVEGINFSLPLPLLILLDIDLQITEVLYKQTSIIQLRF